MEQKEKEEHWYMGFWSEKGTKDAVKDAIQAYMKKYGTPPTIVLLPDDTPDEEVKSLDGYTVRTDPYLFFNNYLIGEIPNDDFEETICLDFVTE